MDPQRPRLAGHKLHTVEWNGEYGAEMASTGHCICGWSESASTKRLVREEYRQHLLAKDREQRALWHRLVHGDDDLSGLV